MLFAWVGVNSVPYLKVRNLRADRRRVGQKIRRIRRSRPSPVTGCGCRHLGVVADVSQDTVAPKIPRVSVNHTNNASERAIGRSKVRYKSREVMKNGIALTQWLYNGEDAHDLAKEMAE